MLRPRRHPDATVSTRRVEAFTDGVFAIAATLLVLSLTEQRLDGATTDAALAEALRAMAMPVMTFVIGFVILCLMWRTHVQQFEFITRIDVVGIWINTARLLCVVFVPFTAALNTDHGELLLGRLLLPINFFVAILLGWLQWVWAVRSASVSDLSPEEVRSVGRGGLSAVLIALVVVAASPFVGSWAFLLFLADGLLTRALAGRSRTEQPGPHPTDGGVGGRG